MQGVAAVAVPISQEAREAGVTQGAVQDILGKLKKSRGDGVLSDDGTSSMAKGSQYSGGSGKNQQGNSPLDLLPATTDDAANSGVRTPRGVNITPRDLFGLKDPTSTPLASASTRASAAASRGLASQQLKSSGDVAAKIKELYGAR